MQGNSSVIPLLLDMVSTKTKTLILWNKFFFSLSVEVHIVSLQFLIHKAVPAEHLAREVRMFSFNCHVSVAQ